MQKIYDFSVRENKQNFAKQNLTGFPSRTAFIMRLQMYVLAHTTQYKDDVIEFAKLIIRDIKFGTKVSHVIIRGRFAYFLGAQ